jgi:hypothetical protein
MTMPEVTVVEGLLPNEEHQYDGCVLVVIVVFIVSGDGIGDGGG